MNTRRGFLKTCGGVVASCVLLKDTGSEEAALSSTKEDLAVHVVAVSCPHCHSIMSLEGGPKHGMTEWYFYCDYEPCEKKGLRYQVPSITLEVVPNPQPRHSVVFDDIDYRSPFSR